MIAYVVTAPCVVVKDSTGKLRYVYRDGVLPHGIPDTEVQRVFADGMLAVLELPDPVAVELPPPADDPGEVPPDGGQFTEPIDGDPPLEPATLEPPPKSANKPDWVDYAVSMGADPDEANGLTKDELIAAYGGG